MKNEVRKVCPYIATCNLQADSRAKRNDIIGRIMYRLQSTLPFDHRTQPGINGRPYYSADVTVTCAPGDGTSNCMREQLFREQEIGQVSPHGFVIQRQSGSCAKKQR